MHVLVDLDGVAEALGDLDVVEVRPLGGELRGGCEHGHEGAREGALTTLGAGADDHLQRYLHSAQMHLASGVTRGKDRIKRRQVGASRCVTAKVAFAAAEGLSVLLAHGGGRLLSGSMPCGPTCSDKYSAAGASRIQRKRGDFEQSGNPPTNPDRLGRLKRSGFAAVRVA